MSDGSHQALMSDPQVNVAAMAVIVNELVTGGVARIEDCGWLKERAQGSRLSEYEYEALEALRVHIVAKGEHLLDPIRKIVW